MSPETTRCILTGNSHPKITERMMAAQKRNPDDLAILVRYLTDLGSRGEALRLPGLGWFNREKGYYEVYVERHNMRVKERNPNPHGDDPYINFTYENMWNAISVMKETPSPDAPETTLWDKAKAGAITEKAPEAHTGDNGDGPTIPGLPGIPARLLDKYHLPETVVENWLDEVGERLANQENGDDFLRRLKTGLDNIGKIVTETAYSSSPEPFVEAGFFKGVILSEKQRIALDASHDLPLENIAVLMADKEIADRMTEKQVLVAIRSLQQLAAMRAEKVSREKVRAATEKTEAPRP